MPETLESFLDDIVRKRKSGIIGDEFMAKDITPRQSLLGVSPLDFPNTLNHILDSRRQSQEDYLLSGPKTPPLVAASSSTAVPGRPVLLPNTDPYSLAASAVAKPEQARPISSLSAAASQNDSVVNVAAMKKYPMLEDFIKPATSDSYIGNAHRRTTLLPDVFPSTSATSSVSASYLSSPYPLFDRQINKSSNNNDGTSNLDVKQLLSGQTSSSASLRMSDAESYFMSNVSTNDLSSILKQLEKEEQKIRQNKLAKETETPREVDVAKLFGQGMTQTTHDTLYDDDDVEIPMPDPSSIDSRPVNVMPPPLSPSVTFSQPPKTSSSSLTLAQNSAVDKWADEMLEKLQQSQSIGRENDSLNEILKKITSSNRNKDAPSNLLNVYNATNSSIKFSDNSSVSIDDDSSIHKTLSALRLLLDVGSDQEVVKKVDNFIK
uniref:Uncharacterized protein n=1 Tax=Romanomermis culicivorax TaxID=13658 RepID=A0A915KWJ4_ROMCU